MASSRFSGLFDFQFCQVIIDSRRKLVDFSAEIGRTSMRLHSISNPGKIISFAEAVNLGIAEDGGLFMPVEIPRLPDEFFESAASSTFQEMAFNVAQHLLEREIPDGDLRTIVEESMNFPVPLRQLTEQTSVLELFHGPTLAFKDFGARFMAKTMAYLHRNDSRELSILVATSGDTGSAVAHGFHNVKGMSVFLLYPSGRVSHIQEQQLTTLTGNVTALEIEGSFDDCQRLVKQAFTDLELTKRRKLTSANSINIARLLPQTFYYFSAVAQGKGTGLPLVFSVPSGNLGNLTAGLIAWKMGLPVKRFVAATNANRVLPQYLESGVFKAAKSIATLSNAMDVGNPSNLARITYLFKGSIDALRSTLYSRSFSDEETKMCIAETYAEDRYVLDPHGAVGMLALQSYRDKNKSPVHGIVLETAHPAKFMDVYDDAMREAIEVPERLRESMQGTKRSVKLSSKFEGLRAYLLDTK
jgi:threonine synthase